MGNQQVRPTACRKSLISVGLRSVALLTVTNARIVARPPSCLTMFSLCFRIPLFFQTAFWHPDAVKLPFGHCFSTRPTIVNHWSDSRSFVELRLEDGSPQPRSGAASTFCPFLLRLRVKIDGNVTTFVTTSSSVLPALLRRYDFQGGSPIATIEFECFSPSYPLQSRNLIRQHRKKLNL